MPQTLVLSHRSQNLSSLSQLLLRETLFSSTIPTHLHHNNTMSHLSLVLFNGLQVTDDAPGEVNRYRQLRPGSWLAARILVYVYPSFPQLWTPMAQLSRTGTDTGSTGAFQYKWRTWVNALESMPKNCGAWTVLAARLAEIGTTSSQISDISRAIMELSMRDAEIQRNPKQLEAYKEKDVFGITTVEEQAIMSRIRSATGYAPRLRRVEKCIYRALAVFNVQIVHAIASVSPPKCSVFEVLNEARF